MYRILFAKRRTSFCNNSSQLLTTWILPTFDFWEAKCTKQGWCCSFYSALRATIWNFKWRFVFKTYLYFTEPGDIIADEICKKKCGQFSRNWHMLSFRLLTRILNLVAVGTIRSNDATVTRTSKKTIGLKQLCTCNELFCALSGLDDGLNLPDFFEWKKKVTLRSIAIVFKPWGASLQRPSYSLLSSNKIFC